MEQNAYTRAWQAAAHLAAFVPIPLGSVVGPIVVWIIRRDCAPVVAEAKKALNFQISALIYFVALISVPATLLAVTTFFTRGPLDWFERHTHIFGVGLAVLGIAWPIAWTVLVIVAAVAASVDRQFRYPLSITLLR